MSTATQQPEPGDLVYYDPDDLVPAPDVNPRRRHDPEKHRQLVASLRRQGMRQPIAVWVQPSFPHWIVVGERRWRGAKEAGIRVPAVPGEYTLAEAIEVALIENLQRDDMTPIEEARGMQHLIDVAGLSQKEVAERVSKDQSWVSNRIRLLALPDEVLDLIDEGRLFPSHARDYLLPWKDLKPHAVRAKLYAEIATKIAEQTEEDVALPGGEVHQIVGTTAHDLSRDVRDRGEHYYRYGNQERPLFDPEEHEECPCGAPAFQYFTHGTKEVRCFHEQWWRKANKDAKKRRDREAATKQAEREQQAAAVAKDGPVDASELDKRVPFSERTTVAQSRPDRGIHFTARVGVIDPSRLPAESLVVVKHAYPTGTQYELVCTRPGSVSAAKGQITREKNAVIDERRAQRLERDRAEAADLAVEPWMLVELIALDGHNHGHDPIRETAAEMGVDLPSSMNERAGLRKMETDALIELAKVYAIRSRRGDFSDWGDALEREIMDELRAKYEPQLRDLLPAAGPKEKAEAA